MEFYGFCAQGLHGGIYRHATENGAMCIEDFVVGEMPGFGKGCLKYL
jgi:hypothetical protein